MKNTKNKKHTILLSVLIIVCCIALCVGATFAFFTNAVTSQNNKVQAGRLKVDLELVDRNDSTKSTSIKTSQAPIFDYTLWEPGYTDVKVLKVENEGDLAIKWQAQYVNNGKNDDIINVLEVYINKSTTANQYPTARGDLDSWDKYSLTDFIAQIGTILNGTLEAGQSSYFGIALRMNPEAGNEYQGQVFGKFDIKILATQQTEEFDAFDDQYDKDACVHPTTTVKFTSANKNKGTLGTKTTTCNECKKQWREPNYLAFNGGTINGIVDGYQDTEIVIPSSINGVPTTSISIWAFANNTTITSVVIPEGVTTIGREAFGYCSSLTHIEIPNTVKQIDWRAFWYCTSLTSVTIPESVTSNGGNIFQGCTGLKSVKILGDCGGSAIFWQCTNLETAEFGPNVTSISPWCFDGCTSLKNVILPNGLKSIGGGAFNKCSSLESIVLPDSVENIGGSAFYACPNLKSIAIPDSVTSIGSQAFRLSGITSVEFGENSKLTSIGSQAFTQSSITSIIIPESVTTIGESAFSDCQQLTTITLPPNLQKIEAQTFFNCKALQSVTILGAITSIGDSAFERCLVLASITIPANVTHIGKNAFKLCNALNSASKVHFENPDGWWVTQDANATSGTPIDVANALWYLKSEYYLSCVEQTPEPTPDPET